MTKSRAEELLEEGLRTSLLLETASPDDLQTLSSVEHIIDVSQQALNLGLVGRDEILCRVMLGSALYKMAMRGHEIETIFSNGINHVPVAYRSLTEFEMALKQDAQRGGIYFVEPNYRGAYFSDMEALWLLQSRYLKESSGNNSAISYLQEKISSVNYLQGTFLPAISLELSQLMLEEGNKEDAIRWLHHACNAEVSELDSDSISATSKRMAQNNLAQLTRPPENVQKGGCFIATAVYGSEDVAEVRFLRKFRDEILLKTRSGRLFVSCYYSVSPMIAKCIKQSIYAKKLIQVVFFRPVLCLLRYAIGKNEWN